MNNPIQYERQQAELGRSELAAQRAERFGDAWLTKEEAEQRKRLRGLIAEHVEKCRKLLG